MLLRGDKPWTRTTIRLAKVQNSDRIDKAGVELQDRRIKLIQAADGVLKTVFAIGGSDAPRGSASADERDAGCQLLSVSVGPAEQRPLSFGLSSAAGRSCPPLARWLQYSEFPLARRIVDPDWIEFAAFPRKGSVKMHSQCAVLVTTENDPYQPVGAVIGAAIAQALDVLGIAVFAASGTRGSAGSANARDVCLFLACHWCRRWHGTGFSDLGPGVLGPRLVRACRPPRQCGVDLGTPAQTRARAHN